MLKFETINEDDWRKAVSCYCPDPRRVKLKDVYSELKKDGIYISIVSILPELGYNQSNQSTIFKKLIRIDSKIKIAYENNFYLEWLSLLLIKTEFWLRVFLFNQNKYDNKNVLCDGLSFGTILNDCRIARMDLKLLKKLKLLNKRRNQYIHEYLKRDFDYDSIKKENLNFEQIVEELRVYCVENSIRILENPEELDNTIGFVRPVRLNALKK
jgi:hypothetical protein